MEELNWLVLCMKHVLDSLTQPVTIVDRDGYFVYYNRASARMDGVDPDNILGHHVLEVSPWLQMEDSTLLRCLSEQSRFTDHYQAYNGVAGEQLHYMHSAMPLYGRSGDIIGAIEIGRVLTAGPGKHDNQREVPEIISDDPAMRRQIEAVDIYGASELPVLIYGETGTGKELFARRAHAMSPRAGRSMLCLNCAAIPENLLESTLFGTTRGAFTGAENRKGLLALADGGTLFLDELNSMPITLQSKLLRVLQDGYYRPLGSQEPLKADIRLITAMNQPPFDAVRDGNLREDLYYRISVGFIVIPPLRNRMNDIGLIARRFVSRYGPALNPAVTHLGETAIRQLEQHDWPGNVRELENVIRRSLLLAGHEATMETVTLMPDSLSDLASGLDNRGALPLPAARPLRESLASYETQLIRTAVQRHNHNLSAVARELALPRTTLLSRMQKLGIIREEQAQAS
ncbi:transcriptional regulator DdaR [Kistimonas scapharcae]|uniref:Transcriptional regulator DdaR n=2 Tax=Kistimonas scapharcae TaxID=1036133 RepID=A0ABP8V668_9GAMM